MHRRSNFLVGLAAAALTFGSLWFAMGSEHFNRGCRPCYRMEHCWMHEQHSKECCKQSEKQDKVIVIKEVLKADTVKK